ncbi:MAG: hypothetical protein IH969_09505, partial [Candidatus Krumholzibacteriota bacterium]|nr:hypothetical protein [Candidatus Krumholzibacteriota bacterium]
MNNKHEDKVNLEKQLEAFGITEDDLGAIRSFGKQAAPQLNNFVDDFYVWLRTRPEYAEFFSDPDTETRVRVLQMQYWSDIVTANLHESFVEGRLEVAETHARINLPVTIFMAATSFSLDWFLTFMSSCKMSSEKYGLTRHALTKFVNMDSA